MRRESARPRPGSGFSARLALALTVPLALAACGSRPPAPATADQPLEVVATSELVADWVRQVAGDVAVVRSILPPGTDPRSADPSLRAAGQVARADLAFSIYSEFESRAVLHALEAHLPEASSHVSLVEDSLRHGADPIALIENPALDAPWLGLSVRDDRSCVSCDVRLVVTGVSGPGEASAFITESFGRPRPFFASADGIDPAGRAGADSIALTPGAHTHMSWVFTRPGVYRVALATQLARSRDEVFAPIASSELVFAVGVDARSVAAERGGRLIEGGHADLATDVASRTLTLDVDSVAKGAGAAAAGHAHQHGAGGAKSYAPESVVVSVPTRTLSTLPDSGDFAFVGGSGEAYVLAQAVLGRALRGEVDPHMWHDVANVRAFVRTIRDEMTRAAPQHRQALHARAQAYLDRLDTLERWLREQVALIPAFRRHLVTGNNSFAYLARARDLSVAAYVSAEPGREPSLRERRAVARSIDDLLLPALFKESSSGQTRTGLDDAALTAGLPVCTLHDITLSASVPTYESLMRANVSTLRRCLDVPLREPQRKVP